MSSPSGVKPQLDEAAVLALLQGHFAASIEGLAIVTGGLVAQTYAFSADGEDYIIRFNRQMGANFDKEYMACSILACRAKSRW